MGIVSTHTFTCDNVGDTPQGHVVETEWVPDGVNLGPDGWHVFYGPEAGYEDGYEPEVYCDACWEHLGLEE